VNYSNTPGMTLPTLLHTYYVVNKLEPQPQDVLLGTILSVKCQCVKGLLGEKFI